MNNIFKKKQSFTIFQNRRQPIRLKRRSHNRQNGHNPCTMDTESHSNQTSIRTARGHPTAIEHYQRPPGQKSRQKLHFSSTHRPQKGIH